MDPKLHSASAFTDPNGIWAFHGLPPGRYVVGVNLLEPPTIDSPYPRTFYTAGTETREATPVDVVDGRQVQLDLRVGPRLATRSVSGVVLNEKETPVRDANILFSDVDLPTATGFRTRGTSDEDGRFSVLAMKGRSYFVRAEAYPSAPEPGFSADRCFTNRADRPKRQCHRSQAAAGTCGPDRARPAPPRRRGEGILGGREHGSHLDRQKNGSPMSGGAGDPLLPVTLPGRVRVAAADDRGAVPGLRPLEDQTASRRSSRRSSSGPWVDGCGVEPLAVATSRHPPGHSSSAMARVTSSSSTTVGTSVTLELCV